MKRSLLLSVLLLAACSDAGSVETVTLESVTDVGDGCVLVVRDADGAESEQSATADACQSAALFVGEAITTTVVDGVVVEVGPAPGVAGGAETP